MPSVIVLDDLSQEGLDLLDAAEGITYEVRTGLKGDDLRQALSEFDGAICRSGVKLTPDVLEGQTKLKAVVRAGVGTDNIDKPAATRAGIVVMNTPAGNTISTAEHAFALMLAMSRNVAPAYQSLLEGRWDRKKFMGTQLAGKTLGVVGLGRIGLALVERAQAFEMNVIGYDPFMSAERAAELGIELVAKVPDMLPKIDYLSVHTPLTEETKDMIDAAALEIIKPGARLVNAARGGIYNEAALVEGLKSGKLAGVALDVYPDEPCTDSPLFGMPGVVCTPHLGASTEEAQTNVAVEAVELLTAFLMTGAIRCAVNVPSVDPKTLESVRGYLDVSHRLGRMAAGIAPSGITSCKLHYRGEVCERDTKLLTSAFAAGLLEGAMEESVNLINAETLLRDRGIEVVEECRSDMGAFRSSISVEVTAGGVTRQIAGTLFGQNMPRLVGIDDYRLEAFLDGCLLVFCHKDVPGIIGGIGAALGGHNVNIAQMAVGRAGNQPGGGAIGVLNLDGEPPQAALDDILKINGITSATVVHLPAAGSLPSWLG
ncbi:D-3-phosphoglycerate dehydrogenase [Posidoniimonas polymericola]|uniref:D-3-phosphoglycerate dehydrogenase n=1 Tax=Posidoniimonas polymericola TaxID=2528002 RepID=A0A5C5YSE2_9BACT|nr:phosphoglycerate dehydrogenase [Posidoniimonas polymericola]TWT77902.1 D-3-phosphoglycerate dehydrogenase [Posidoniimonas polymericola]